jgi:7-cyano-7-deazaguanine synthase
MSSSRPAVVLLSGGLDSSVLLHHVAKELHCPAIHALSFNYGQRHDRELVCAAAQSRIVGTKAHRVMDITFMGTLIQAGSALIQGGAEVPDLDALTMEELTQPPTYVPNRNMMLLSMATAYAEAHGITDIYYGAQAQDEYGYWDCTRGFLERINAVLALNRKTPVTVHAPFVGYSKEDTVRIGIMLGVDFGQTWSCYRGGEEACGTCPTCVERLNAFAANHREDPIGYTSS